MQMILLFCVLAAAGTSLDAAAQPNPANNAALHYWRALQFHGIEPAKPTERSSFELVRQGLAGRFDAATVAYLNRAQRYLDHMRRGAQHDHCEWGRQTWPPDITHLSLGRSLATIAAARVRHLVALDRDDESVDLLIAAFRFSQHLEGGDFLMSLLIKNSTSSVLINAAAAALPDLSRSAAEKLADSMDERVQEFRSDVADTFRNDYLFGISQTKPSVDQPELSRDELIRVNERLKEIFGANVAFNSAAEISIFADQLEQHVTDMAELIRSAQPSELEKKLHAYAIEHDFRGLATMAESGARAAQSEYATRIRFALFRAALAVVNEGEAALARYKERNEAGRPFQIRRKFRDTFELESDHRLPNGRRLRLAVGDLDSIHTAAANGDLALVEHHLSSDVFVNARDDSNRTPLHHAAAAGNEKVVDILLNKGADVNSIWPGPNSAGTVVRGIDPEMAKRYGLGITTPTPAQSVSDHMTAVDLAVDAGHKETAEILRRRGGKSASELITVQ